MVRCMACVVVAGLTGSAFGQFLEADVEVLHTITGQMAGDNLGFVGDVLGDVDGDGLNDIVLGGAASDAGAINGGRAWVISGFSGEVIWDFIGTAQGEFLGAAVADAGDVDGDGVTDVIVGVPGAPFGTPTIPGSVIVYSGATGEEIWTAHGEMNGDKFGIDVDGLRGDVNGDGVNDVIVGAEFFDPDGVFNAGRVYLLSGADGSVLFSVDGPEQSDSLGNGVAGVGDVDGDGVVDFAAAARNAGPLNKGLVWVRSGVDGALIHTLEPADSAQGFGYFFLRPAGDVDADGVGDVFVPDFGDTALGAGTGHGYVFSGATGELIWDEIGEKAGEGFGIGGMAGDVDGDGFDDIFVAAWVGDGGAPNAGKGYVYSGADGSLIRTMTGTNPNFQLGYDAVGVGDVNGDGSPDFMLTGPAATLNGPASGVAYVIAGAACPADFNGDGETNILDFVDYQVAFLAGDPSADCDGDGQFTILDFVCFQLLFAEGC